MFYSTETATVSIVDMIYIEALCIFPFGIDMYNQKHCHNLYEKVLNCVSVIYTNSDHY